MSVTTKTQIPERAHHVFIDAGSDTLAGLVRTVEQIAQDLERDTTASSVWGGYSDGGWWVYEASKITHDEYMATINDSLAQPDNYERRSNAQVVTDAERTALIAALRAERARVRDLEEAARIDIDDANNSCAVRDCKSWTERGIVCPNCPCHEVSESARVLGIELASSQKLADAGQATP